MGMRKIGAPAESSVHGVVVSNLDEPKEQLKKEADENKKDKKED